MVHAAFSLRVVVVASWGVRVHTRLMLSFLRWRSLWPTRVPRIGLRVHWDSFAIAKKLDRICLARLGSVQVRSRSLWKNALANRLQASASSSLYQHPTSTQDARMPKPGFTINMIRLRYLLSMPETFPHLLRTPTSNSTIQL